MKIAVAGAGGFVGTALVERLRKDHDVIAFSRGAARPDPAVGGSRAVEWRSCDLFSMLQAERALEGVDVAIYLVHSLRPSTHLNQARSRDLDLIVADNFVRAAEKKNLKQIIYLGGLLPDESKRASANAKDRREVEEVFQSSRVPETILRSGLILGAGGFSFRILRRLVDRLPVVPCPRWTRTPIQPVALEDVVEALAFCVGRPNSYNRIYDVAGPEIVSVMDLMKTLAKEEGRMRRWWSLPSISSSLASRLVALVTGAPAALVRAWAIALKNSAKARPEFLLCMPGHEYKKASEALCRALREDSGKTSPRFDQALVARHEVRSVQRLPLPPGWNAEDVARGYLQWLPRQNPVFMCAEVEGHRVSFCWRWPHWELLRLEYSPERSGPHRQLFYVRGGLLSKAPKNGRLEFRETIGGTHVLSALHNFSPSLPWMLYRWTQAWVHVWTMKQFSRYLTRRLRRGTPPARPAPPKDSGVDRR